MRRLIRNTKGISLLETSLFLAIGTLTIAGVLVGVGEMQSSANTSYELTAVAPEEPMDVDTLIERYGTKTAVDETAGPRQFLSSELAQWDLTNDLPRDGASDRQISLNGGALGYLEFGDTDAYWLEVPTRAAVTIALEGVDHGAGRAGDPDLTIQTADGAIVERGSSDGGERVVANLEAGRYLVTAKLYGSETGHYELRATSSSGQ
jgi:hypothetical protein